MGKTERDPETEETRNPEQDPGQSRIQDRAGSAGHSRICRTEQDLQDRAGSAGQSRICRTEQDLQDRAGSAGQSRICRTEQDPGQSRIQDRAGSRSYRRFPSLTTSIEPDHGTSLQTQEI